jgi:hypothetical protein
MTSLQTSTKGRPKGSKNNIVLLDVDTIIKQLGHDSNVKIPVPKNWYTQIFR